MSQSALGALNASKFCITVYQWGVFDVILVSEKEQGKKACPDLFRNMAIQGKSNAKTPRASHHPR